MSSSIEVTQLLTYPSLHSINASSKHSLSRTISRASFSINRPRQLHTSHGNGSGRYIDVYYVTSEIDDKILSNAQAKEDSFESKLLDNEPTNEAYSELPPVDGGKNAWSYLVAAFVLEALCWGFPFSYGVFQAYYMKTAPFIGNSKLSIVGTLASGLPYLTDPLIFPLISKYPMYRKHMMHLGNIFCVLSCVTASFAKNVETLIVTQGVLYGCGASLLYSPLLSYLNEWFVARRGLAYGIMFGGAGVSGLVLPLILESFLRKYGYQSTLRIWAVTMFVLATPCLFLVKSRLPSSYHANNSRRISFNFLRSKIFCIFCFSNSLHGLCYFLPSIYLPSYAIDLGLSNIQSTMILSTLNLASVFGQIALGFASDKMDVYIPFVTSTVLSGIAVLTLWGFSKTFAVLIVFSIMYGITAGGYSVLWGRFAMEIVKDDVYTQLTVMGLLTIQRGIGSVLSGPISSVLLNSSGSDNGYAIGKYERMVLFTGTLLVVASLGGLGACLRKGRTSS